MSADPESRDYRIHALLKQDPTFPISHMAGVRTLALADTAFFAACEWQMPSV